MSAALHLRVLPETLAVARLDAADPVPPWALEGEAFASVTRRGDELSVVCAQELVPDDATAWRGLRGLEVQGPLDFDLVGVMAALSGALADAGVWILALATYDTDVILVKGDDLDAAVAALEARGHRVSRRT